MSLARTLARNFLVVAAGFIAAQCGGERPEKNFHISAIPDAPIIFDTPLIINAGQDDQETLAASWFRLNFKFTNNTQQEITIQNVKVTVDAFKKDGSTDTATFLIDPKGYDEDNLLGYLTYLYPGESEYPQYQLLDIPSGYTCTGAPAQRGTHATLPAINCGNYILEAADGWTIYGMPNVGLRDYRFKITIEPIGWFGPPDNAQGRLHKKLVIFGQ